MPRRMLCVTTVALMGWLSLCALASAQAPGPVVVPHNQSAPPNEPRSPEEAVKHMVVPAGFKVEIVAAEPDLVNPVAMAFDERGRIWVTESLEYPRASAGPGQDRVKVLEDTDGDGRADKVTVFAEGLNIPSGIAVGYGGVWVANAPDLLLLQDTDGDGKADKQQVVVTGFGRYDTHELPNSLTWGPDGWLYGLNGVFNPSKIEYRGKLHEFTCAMFRINPRTMDFEVFCEGTSNPWGIAFDPNGSAFVSACVIDHLWHLSETGYYHRQGGPYPPFTWKMESIVDFKHQKAAYCGIHYYDSDAYPAPYRDKLYMGNIHGNCINVDSLTRQGSTYRGKHESDFLSANDAWFMPIVQKTGPDGCLYILDWYDRYHCYQDAKRDPAGIDRLKGRLYRIRYQDTPRAQPFNLATETDEQLLGRLDSRNGLLREIALRLLVERSNDAIVPELKATVLDENAARSLRLHALWALVGKVDADFIRELARLEDATFRAWAVRLCRGQRLTRVMASDESPDVQLQLAVEYGRAGDTTALLNILTRFPHDLHLAQVTWRNLQAVGPKKLDIDDLTKIVATQRLDASPVLQAVLPRMVDQWTSMSEGRAAAQALLAALLKSPENVRSKTFAECLDMVANKIFSGELPRSEAEGFNAVAREAEKGQPTREVAFAAAVIAGVAQEPTALDTLFQLVSREGESSPRRSKAFETLVVAGDERYLDLADRLIDDGAVPLDVRRGVLLALTRSQAGGAAQLLIAEYAHLDPELQPLAMELLTQRPSWIGQLLRAVEDKDIASSDVNINQIQRLAKSKDTALAERVKAIWGTVRTERNPAREQIVAEMRNVLSASKGDPHKGLAVFSRVCGQCHKIYGHGQEVGPDITVNGRASIEQLLSNLFDPSLVIGRSYQAWTVVTSDGRTLTGLLSEDSPQRVVLKTQGGKIETIARGDVDEMEQSKLSMMPEGLEKQLKPDELADLFAFLRLDKPPADPLAKPLPDVKK